MKYVNACSETYCDNQLPIHAFCSLLNKPGCGQRIAKGIGGSCIHAAFYCIMVYGTDGALQLEELPGVQLIPENERGNFNGQVWPYESSTKRRSRLAASWPGDSCDVQQVLMTLNQVWQLPPVQDP